MRRLGNSCSMAVSLKVAHLPRYKNIATLLIKHWRSEGLKNFDPSAPGAADPAMVDDARKLADDLESMGPTFIKLGQLLSTRADLLPPAYLDALSRLQDKVGPFSFAEVGRIVEPELGVRIPKAFASFDSKPIASASLG